MGNQTNIKSGLMIVAFLLVMAGSARSQWDEYIQWGQYTGWVSNGIGNWSNDDNWDNGEPTNGTFAGIGFGGTVQITEVGEECDNLLLVGTNVEMSSGSLLVIKEEYIEGAFTQTGGVHWSKGFLDIGDYSEGTYNLSGEGELYASWELIGFHRTGTFNHSGGTNTVEDILHIAREAGSIGTYALSGGTLSAQIIEFGAGSGAFNFNAGRLSVGTFEGNLYNYGGTLAPGSPRGSYPRLTCIEGNYEQQSTGVLEIELGGTDPGIQYDMLSVTGSLTLNGTLNVVLINGFNPQVGDQFFILDFNPAQFGGSFATIDLPDLPKGLFWDTTQLYTTGCIIAQRKPSTLNLLSPIGGETLTMGSTYSITWESSGTISDVLIHYTTDGGHTWAQVYPQNIGNSGIYQWRVPSVESIQCRVWISDATNRAEVCDGSDTVFAIRESPFRWPIGSK